MRVCVLACLHVCFCVCLCVGHTCRHLGPGDGWGRLSLGLTVQPGHAAGRDGGAPDVGVRDPGLGPLHRDLGELNKDTSYIRLALQIMNCVFLFPSVQCFIDLYQMSARAFPNQWYAMIKWTRTT